MSASFIVKRHGGNSNHNWRLICLTNDLELATLVFERTKKKMRQGALIMEDSNGEIVRRYEAPPVRTRW